MFFYSALCFLDIADVEGPASHGSEYVSIGIYNSIYIAWPVNGLEGRKNTDFLYIESNLVANLSDERVIDLVLESLISEEGTDGTYNIRGVLL